MGRASPARLTVIALLFTVPACNCSSFDVLGKRDAGGQIGCTSNADCPSPLKPVCDVPVHTCVQCLTTPECKPGNLCENMECIPGCETDPDCHLGDPSPALMGDTLCQTTTHTCVECTTYNNCGPGMVCDCTGKCSDPGATQTCLDCSRPCGTEVISGNGFTQGTVTALQIDPNAGLTTLPPSSMPPLQQTPWLWIPNHGNPSTGAGGATVSKIDASTGALLGTFSSGGQGPSRGAMPLDGSMWVGNRCPWDPNNPACSNLVHLDVDGSILCTVSQAADGAVTPFVRGVALDAHGYVWFSTWNDQRVHKVDPVACKAILDIDYTTNPGAGGPTAGYGLIVDQKGILWNSSIGTGPFVGIDTNTGAFVYSVPNQGYASYGITCDMQGNIWYASYCAPEMLMIDAATQTLHVFPGGITQDSEHGAYCARGVTIDTAGDVWAAWWSENGLDNYVTKWNSNGFVAQYHEPIINNGVAINGDTYGNVWLSGTLGALAGSSSGSQGSIRFPNGISADGQYDVMTTMTGGYPYSYADLTGLIYRSVTSQNPQYGIWVMSFDSMSTTTTWERSTWDAIVPQGTGVAVTFTAAPTAAGLATAPACGPFTSSPVDLTMCPFQNDEWLGVQVALQTNNVNVQPSMNNLKVYYQQ